MVFFKGKGGGEARNASQVAREGWHHHHPALNHCGHAVVTKNPTR